MFKLIIEDDEGKTTVVPLIRDEITIGRKEGNTIRLTERNVSRKHAKLLKQNGTIFIEDLTSYNGIKVNGDRIAGRAPVNEGDRIQIGDYQLALKMDKAAGAGPTEVRDEKTTPFIKDNGATPTAMMDMAPTVQNPLVSGEHLDLGHVRLRFGSTGEDVVFERDAQIVDVGGAKKPKVGLIVGAVVAVLLIGIGIVVISKMTGKGDGSPGGKLSPAEAEAQ